MNAILKKLSSRHINNFLTCSAKHWKLVKKEQVRYTNVLFLITC